MAALDPPANVARFAFEVSALPPGTFCVVSFDGEEALSELFSFTLQLSSKDPDLNFEQIVGQPATLTVDRAGEAVPTYGLVTDLKQNGRSGSAASGYVSYTATLRPRLWRATLQENSRVFQQQSVPDILEVLLKERLGFAPSQDFELKLSGAYSQLEYCVQHEETNLGFLKRLTKREGLYFYFDHTMGRDRLVVCDDRQAHEKIAAPEGLVYGAGAGMNRPVIESIQRFSVHEQLVEAAAELHSYNYETPRVDLRAKEKAGASGGAPETLSQKVTDAFPDAGQGKRLAKVRAEALACRRRQIRGASDCGALRAGRLFTLEGHYRADLNGADYLVVNVQHGGSQRGALPPGAGILPDGVVAPEAAPGGDGQAEAPSYHNTFDCMPATVQYRPKYDPADKPRLPGLTTAMVESSGEGSSGYPYLDEEGRYRARLHFDQRSGRAPGTATLPIRLAQPSSGPGSGTHLPNPAGTELVIGYVDGDPDRPLALGTAPNPTQRSPVTARNRSQSIIRTPGGNELVLEDKKEKAFAQLRTPGGHVLTLTDAEKRAQLLSATGHRATLDDEARRIEVQTREGHQLRLDDEARRIQLQTKGKHRLVLDEKNERLELSDAEGKCAVRIDFGADHITVESEEGGVALKAPQGEVAIESKTFRLKTDGAAVMDVGGKMRVLTGSSMTLEAKGAFEASGKTLTAEGKASATFSGTASTTLKGTQVAVQATMVRYSAG